jgi:hypothetical protein
MASADQVRALEGIMNIFADPQSRRRFFADPQSTLEEAQVDTTPLPQEVVDAMFALTPSEMKALSSLNRSMVEAGLLEEGTEYLGKQV